MVAPETNDPVELPVSEQWIEEKLTLRHGQKANLVGVSDVKRIDEGHGFMSFILSVTLHWQPSNTNLPSKVLFKILNTSKMRELMTSMIPDGDGVEEMFETMEQQDTFARLHQNECRLYELFSKDKVQGPYPICYHTLLQSKEKAGMLVLEDFTSRGTCVNLLDGLSVEQALQVAETVANYQAYSLLRDEWKSLFYFPDPKDFEQFAASAGPTFDMMLALYPEECGQIKKEDVLELMSIGAKGKSLMDCTGKYCPQVLVHGDLWINNIIFEKQDGKFTNRLLAVIDWQVTHPSNPGEDLARVLCTSMDGDIRRANELKILQHYYDKLGANLQQHNKSIPFSFEDVIAWYYRAMRFQAFQALVMPHLLSTKGQYDPAVVRRCVMRGVYATQDTLQKATWDFLKE